MVGNTSGVSSYQQINQVWNSSRINSSGENPKTTQGNSSKSTDEVKVSEWKPLAGNSSLVPVSKAGYGMVIGDLELSDKAKDYYDKLKSKFHGMDFILVSKDVKSQVAANASAYGNANKPVVLIDDEKLERMANDESFRKKYEGIIAMSQTKLQQAKNSLVSSGANVKNFGMSVGSDGKASFFATIEKANTARTKALAKKQAEKKADRDKEKKQAEKKAQEERLEKRREENRAEKTGKNDHIDDKEYIEFRSDSIDALMMKVTKYTYDNSLNSVMTEEESRVGQKFDFRG